MDRAGRAQAAADHGVVGSWPVAPLMATLTVETGIITPEKLLGGNDVTLGNSRATAGVALLLRSQRSENGAALVSLVVISVVLLVLSVLPWLLCVAILGLIEPGGRGENKEHRSLLVTTFLFDAFDLVSEPTGRSKLLNAA